MALTATQLANSLMAVGIAAEPAKLIASLVSSGTTSITTNAMSTWFATLPTSPPAPIGQPQPWNNGGVLAFTTS